MEKNPSQKTKAIPYQLMKTQTHVKIQ